jgi:hypothetical protein
MLTLACAAVMVLAVIAPIGALQEKQAPPPARTP